MSRIGGLETFVVNIGHACSRFGWDVHFLSTNDTGDLHAELAALYSVHDLAWMPLSMAKVYAFARLCNELRPSILLLNHCSLAHYALPLLAPGIRPAVVVHSDDDLFYRVASLLRQRVWRWITPTPRLADRLGEIIPKRFRHRIRVIPHGVSGSVFGGRKDLNDGQVCHIAFVGSVLPHKGVDLLPEILHMIRQRVPNTILTIVGDGGYRTELERRFLETGLGNAVEWSGRVPQCQVATALSQSHLLLLPTRVEGFGLVIVEAMMAGAVPVVSRLPGVTEAIVKDGLNGFLVAVDDTESFASRAVELLQNAALWRRMSAAAMDDALQHFSENRMMRDYLSMFAEADDRCTIQPSSRVLFLAEVFYAAITNTSFSSSPMIRLLRLLNHFGLSHATGGRGTIRDK